MKPQTVYLSNQDCFEKEHIQDIDGDFYLKSEGYFHTPEQLKAIIAEAFEAGVKFARNMDNHSCSEYLQQQLLDK